MGGSKTADLCGFGSQNSDLFKWRLGRVYNRRKKRHGERGPSEKLPQIEASFPRRTSESIASEFGVSKGADLCGFGSQNPDLYCRKAGDAEERGTRKSCAKLHSFTRSCGTAERVAAKAFESCLRRQHLDWNHLTRVREQARDQGAKLHFDFRKHLTHGRGGHRT